jgi:hypothetical protein
MRYILCDLAEIRQYITGGTVAANKVNNSITYIKTAITAEPRLTEEITMPATAKFLLRLLFSATALL